VTAEVWAIGRDIVVTYIAATKHFAEVLAADLESCGSIPRDNKLQQESARYNKSV
jgi:hypothetical protein